MAKITGTINRIRFHNEENGHSILIVEDEHRSQHTIVCSILEPSVGGKYEFSGTIKTHPKFGKQLDADEIKPLIPSDKNGMIIYLASGPIKGVGEKLAKRIVDKFGDAAFDVIERTPDRLLEVEGIEKGKLNTIVKSWKENKASHEVMSFLRGHGVGPNRAITIFNKYRENTISIIKTNPYRLSQEVDGIGFEIADKIASTLGIAGNHPDRVKAGVNFLLLNAQSSGDCALLKHDLLRRTERLLGVSRNEVQKAMDEMTASRWLAEDTISDKKVIYLSWMRYIEEHTAERIKELSGPAVLESDVEFALDNSSISLSPSQSLAQELIVNNKLSVITGGPGVGKTTILKTSLEGIMHKNRNLKVRLAAPTGRAAQRMNESTGLPAETIHRMLGFNGTEFVFNAEKPLDCDLLVVDEASMIDISLMHGLMQAVPDHATVILVGDKDQLPSVGPGSVLRDLIDSGAIPVAKLTEIHRQGADSGIITNAHAINNGKKPAHKSDFQVHVHDDTEDMRNTIIDLLTLQMPKETGIDPRDIQILTPSHKGSLGTVNMNELVQSVLNPNPAKEIIRNGVRYGVGDKVIQTKNDYELAVFNGDSGWIEDIDFASKNVVVRFDRGPVVMEFGNMSNISLAWAITIHKSQGSEYPAVIVPVASEHYIMHARNLLYTAVTRGKQSVAIVGDAKSISRSVHNNPQPKRVSGLAERICKEFGIEMPAPAEKPEEKALTAKQETYMGRAMIL